MALDLMSFILGSSANDGSGGGGGSIVVDNQLSLDSVNPVQNKVLTAALCWHPIVEEDGDE